MPPDEQNVTIEQPGNDTPSKLANGTPSTASRIKPAPLENAFPTPPRRNPSRASEGPVEGRQSPVPGRLFGISKSSPAVKEYKSQEILRSSVSGAHNSGLSSSNEVEKSWRSGQVSKKNSQFFDQAFAIREPYYSAKERVTRDSLIVVEFQYNCCLDTEQSFLNDFLMTLSEIYHKPTNNIMVVARPNVHIMMAASTEPAYLVAITAMPSEIAATKNLRTVMIVQDFLAEALQIPVNRGIIKFHPVQEDELGSNKTTVKDEIEVLQAEDKRSQSVLSRQSNRTKRGSTMPSMAENFGDMEQSRSQTPILPATNPFECEDEKETEKPQRTFSSAGRIMRGKKSLMSFWKK
ncbi:hypothetical protein LTR64_008330 [Lithohypha guttulata]|uniref:uncharacterized protein n=1 Tax=Lithohypha guttulata TaxID=1690604 RepID=UPI002DE1A538|nr:hypothetical protein LTR51_008482 [Lithohypha guttulata]